MAMDRQELIPPDKANAVTHIDAERVEHLISSLTMGNKLLRTKHREVLGNIRLLHSKLLYQCPGGEFATAQQLKNCDPSWVSERLKGVGLESTQ